jgi:NAD(P) transhydrogenase subunit alpha
MRIAVPKEVRPEERRVALVPGVVAQLVHAGFEVWVEAEAGRQASFPDAEYVAAGATMLADTAQLWGEADILVKVSAPVAQGARHEVDTLRPGAILIGLLNALGDADLVQRLAARQVTAFGMELIPRLSRAQTMDVLSSQASVAGYKAVLLAADASGKFMPMLTTAAGTIPPARVLVVGAGVAGLMAIATARRLGAVVEAFDIRPAVREEVQSLGATFIDVALDEETVAAGGYAQAVSGAARQREQEVLRHHIQRADIVITTAQVPGKRAPVLVTEAMVAAMQPGAIIVDVAAEQGGNCAYTVAGQEVQRHGVTILGPRNIPSLMPAPASQMYAKNVQALLQHLVRDNAVQLDFDDEIIRGACVTHAGTIRHPQSVPTEVMPGSEVSIQEEHHG